MLNDIDTNRAELGEKNCGSENRQLMNGGTEGGGWRESLRRKLVRRLV